MNTYKANQISGPTAETLAAIAKTATSLGVDVFIAANGLVFRRHQHGKHLVQYVDWLQLTHANDPHGMCAVIIGDMVLRAMEHNERGDK